MKVLTLITPLTICRFVILILILIWLFIQATNYNYSLCLKQLHLDLMFLVLAEYILHISIIFHIVGRMINYFSDPFQANATKVLIQEI